MKEYKVTTITNSGDQIFITANSDTENIYLRIKGEKEPEPLPDAAEWMEESIPEKELLDIAGAPIDSPIRRAARLALKFNWFPDED